MEEMIFLITPVLNSTSGARMPMCPNIHQTVDLRNVFNTKQKTFSTGQYV